MSGCAVFFPGVRLLVAADSWLLLSIALWQTRGSCSPYYFVPFFLLKMGLCALIGVVDLGVDLYWVVDLGVSKVRYA